MRPGTADVFRWSAVLPLSNLQRIFVRVRGTVDGDGQTDRCHANATRVSERADRHNLQRLPADFLSSLPCAWAQMPALPVVQHTTSLAGLTKHSNRQAVMYDVKSCAFPWARVAMRRNSAGTEDSSP